MIYQCKVCGNYGNFDFLIEHMSGNHLDFLRYCNENIREINNVFVWSFDEKKVKENPTFWQPYNPNEDWLMGHKDHSMWYPKLYKGENNAK
jgi:hypothetical protein